MQRKLIRISTGSRSYPKRSRSSPTSSRPNRGAAPSRVPPAKLEAMTARDLVYVVRDRAPALPRARVTAAGAVQLGVAVGNRA